MNPSRTTRRRTPAKLARGKQAKYEKKKHPRIKTDAITGLVVTKEPSRAPLVTSKQVFAALACSCPEKAKVACAVTGMPLRDGSAMTIEIACGYGAPHDGSKFTLDFSWKAACIVLPLVRSLFLDGGPIEPHRTEVYMFGAEPLNEKPISRKAHAKLLRRLDRLHHHRRQTLAGVGKDLKGGAEIER